MQNVTNRIESDSTEIKVLKVVPVPTYIDFDNQVWIEGSGWAFDEGTDGTYVEWMTPELRDSDGTTVSPKSGTARNAIYGPELRDYDGTTVAWMLFTPFDLANLLKAARTVAAGHGLGRGFKCLARVGLVQRTVAGWVLTAPGALILATALQAQGLTGIGVSRQADDAPQPVVNQEGQVVHDRRNLTRPDGRVVGSLTYHEYQKSDGGSYARYLVKVWRLSQYIKSAADAPTAADRLYASQILTLRHRLIWADGFDGHLLRE